MKKKFQSAFYLRWPKDSESYGHLRIHVCRGRAELCAIWSLLPILGIK